jgi:orotate phosphoribosyltransferase
VGIEIESLARDLVDAAYLKGDFVLRSGKRSSYYFDKYLFETKPSILRRLGHELARLVPPHADRIAAPELGAVLLGGAVSMELDKPLVIVRKDAKDYGTSKAVEGELKPGDRVAVVEDILTTGGAAIAAIEKLRNAGADVLCLIGVLDREEGAADNLNAVGVELRALFTKSRLPLD